MGSPFCFPRSCVGNYQILPFLGYYLSRTKFCSLSPFQGCSHFLGLSGYGKLKVVSKEVLEQVENSRYAIDSERSTSLYDLLNHIRLNDIDERPLRQKTSSTWLIRPLEDQYPCCPMDVACITAGRAFVANSNLLQTVCERYAL